MQVRSVLPGIVDGAIACAVAACRAAVVVKDRSAKFLRRSYSTISHPAVGVEVQTVRAASEATGSALAVVAAVVGCSYCSAHRCTWSQSYCARSLCVR